MQTIHNYITESLLFTHNCNKYLGNAPQSIDEGLLDWLKSFFTKTSKFINTWMNKGNKTIKVDTSNGSLQPNNQIVKQPLAKMKNDINAAKTWQECFPNVMNYLQKHESARPEKIDKTDWNDMCQIFLVYTPTEHYDGEFYPTAICYFSEKVHPIDDYIHIFHFEKSSIVEGISEQELFELTVDKIAENMHKTDKVVGLTYTSPLKRIKDTAKLKYKNKSNWEETDAGDTIFKLSIKN